MQGAANLVHDATSWQCEHEWRQDIAVVTKWLTGASPVRILNFYLSDTIIYTTYFLFTFMSLLTDYWMGCM